MGIGGAVGRRRDGFDMESAGDEDGPQHHAADDGGVQDKLEGMLVAATRS